VGPDGDWNNAWSRACGAIRVGPFGFGPSIHTIPAPGAPLAVCKVGDHKPFYWTDTEFSGGT